MCEIFWNSEFLHYYFFGIIGPVVGALIVILFRGRLAERFFLKSAIILSVSSFIFLILNLVVSGRCEVLILGENQDMIGDIGLMIITLPIVFIFFMFSFASVVLVHSKTTSS